MYCTNCGRKIKDGERYCPYCGTKTFNEYEFNQQRVDYAISRRSIPMCIILSIVTFEFMDFIGFIVLLVMSIHLLEKKILQVLKS